MEKQHGKANFSVKCKHCDKKGFLTLDEKSPYKVSPDDHGMIKQVIASI
jgi:hypothetical protein